MQIGFIYANAPSFDEIMERLSELQNRFRALEWQRIRSKVREEYFNNLVRLINETDNTDTDETNKISINSTRVEIICGN